MKCTLFICFIWATLLLVGESTLASNQSCHDVFQRISLPAVAAQTQVQNRNRPEHYLIKTLPPLLDAEIIHSRFFEIMTYQALEELHRTRGIFYGNLDYNLRFFLEISAHDLNVIAQAIYSKMYTSFESNRVLLANVLDDLDYSQRIFNSLQQTEVVTLIQEALIVTAQNKKFLSANEPMNSLSQSQPRGLWSRIGSLFRGSAHSPVLRDQYFMGLHQQAQVQQTEARANTNYSLQNLRATLAHFSQRIASLEASSALDSSRLSTLMGLNSEIMASFNQNYQIWMNIYGRHQDNITAELNTSQQAGQGLKSKTHIVFLLSIFNEASESSQSYLQLSERVRNLIEQSYRELEESNEISQRDILEQVELNLSVSSIFRTQLENATALVIRPILQTLLKVMNNSNLANTNAITATTNNFQSSTTRAAAQQPAHYPLHTSQNMLLTLIQNRILYSEMFAKFMAASFPVFASHVGMRETNPNDYHLTLLSKLLPEHRRYLAELIFQKLDVQFNNPDVVSSRYYSTESDFKEAQTAFLSFHPEEIIGLLEDHLVAYPSELSLKLTNMAEELYDDSPATQALQRQELKKIYSRMMSHQLGIQKMMDLINNEAEQGYPFQNKDLPHVYYYSKEHFPYDDFLIHRSGGSMIII